MRQNCYVEMRQNIKAKFEAFLERGTHYKLYFDAEFIKTKFKSFL